MDLRELQGRPGTLAQRLLDHFGWEHSADGADWALLVDRLVGFGLAIRHRDQSPDARELADFIGKFATASARYGPHHRPVLAYAGPFGSISPVPIDDVAVMCVYWWGYVSPLDTLVVVDEVLSASRVVGDSEAIAELAAWDLELAASLAADWGAEAEAQALLGAYRAAVPEEQGLLREAAAASSMERYAGPPTDLLDAWARGSVNWWGERALVHIGRYPPCDFEAAVRRRIWRGQVAAVLPYVELARERLAGWLDSRSHLVGDRWRYKDMVALEVGPLEKVFHESAGLRRAVPQYELARLLRQTRHRLAHLKHVNRDELVRIQDLMSAGLFT
ncbi:MAG TPA: hypothetical protein VN618_13690 [Solirubrobacteraceae bacterium]|nr:hypothetical protein [Solirubrobacteraceae bacterium]